MNKNDVMKALEWCASSGGDCGDCTYRGMMHCDRHLCEDALVLLQSTDDKHNVTGGGITFCDAPTYHTAIIYTKYTNLMPWLQSNYTKFCTHGTTEQAQRIREMYSKDREVQLILLVRHEDGKCICRIKCPINPLPIKGEFQCVSTGEMSKLLKSMGWTYKEKVHYGMFK